MSLYEIFYNTGYGSDITVKYNNMELKVHKKILIKYSGYFEAMIPHCRDIIDMTICDVDLDPDWLEKLIKSWYTGNNNDVLCIFPSYLEYYRYLKMWEYLICNGDYPCLIIDNYSVELRHDSFGIRSHGKGYKYIELNTNDISNFINDIYGFKLVRKVVKCNKGNLYIHFTSCKNTISLNLDSDCYSCSVPFTSFEQRAVELLDKQQINSL